MDTVDNTSKMSIWDGALTDAIVITEGKIQPYDKIKKHLADHFYLLSHNDIPEQPDFEDAATNYFQDEASTKAGVQLQKDIWNDFVLPLLSQLQEKDNQLLQETGKAMRYSQTIEDLKKENERLKKTDFIRKAMGAIEILEQVNHTLICHNKVDANTPLHLKIQSLLNSES